MEESTKEKILNGTASGDRRLVEFMTLHPVEKETPVKVKVTRAIKCVRRQQERLTLQCEWDDCMIIEHQMESFLRHVGDHSDGVIGDCVCLWRHCKSVLKDRPTFLKHLYFHAFHTKLKCIGANMQEDNDMETCKINSCFINMVPELPDEMQCCWDDCSTYFNNPQALYWHVEIHVVKLPDGKAYNCLWAGCDASFSLRYKLKCHMRTHTQEKLVACPTCGGFFSNKTKYYDHCKRQLEVREENGKQCSHCRKTFASDRLLRIHMRRHVNHYKCPLCDMTTAFPSSLREHIKYRHSDVKNYKCEFCTYKSKTAHELNKHVATHFGGKPYQCKIEGCDFACRAKVTLKVHYSKKHGLGSCRQYRCHICERLYPRGTALTNHLMNIHGFHWPSGHRRFRYKKEPDGFYQLQLVRYESLELTQELMNVEEEDAMMEEEMDDPLDRVDVPITVDEVEASGVMVTINPSTKEVYVSKSYEDEVLSPIK